MKATALSCAFAIMLTSGPAFAGPPRRTVEATERALEDQLRCKREPEVAKAINAMLKNRIIRYKRNYDGEYLFVPTVPLKFLGFRIRYISGFDEQIAFRRAPRSRFKFGGKPFHNLQIDVFARASQLKTRARRAGISESWTSRHHPGLEIDDEPSSMAPRTRLKVAKIRCVAYPSDTAEELK